MEASDSINNLTKTLERFIQIQTNQIEPQARQTGMRIYEKLPNSQPIFSGSTKEDIDEFLFVTESNFDFANIDVKIE